MLHVMHISAVETKLKKFEDEIKAALYHKHIQIY